MYTKSSIKQYKFPLLIMLVALLTYIGFGPLLELTQSELAKHFLSAGFGAIFIAFITLFLMDQQDRNEAQRERNTMIFQEKVKAFNDFYRELEKIIAEIKSDTKKSEENKLSEEQLNRLIFKLSNLRTHTELETIKSISEAINKLFTSEGPGLYDENILTSQLFNVVRSMNAELLDKDGQLTDEQKEFREQIVGIIQGLANDIPRKGATSKVVSKSNKGQTSLPTHYYAVIRKEDDWDWLRANGLWEGGHTNRIVNMIQKVKKGDMICAYKSQRGYVAYGEVLDAPFPGSEFEKKFPDKYSTMSEHTIKQIEDGYRLDEDGNRIKDAEEYFIPVKWTEKSIKNHGWDNREGKGNVKDPDYFSSPTTICNMDKQETTIKAVSKFFS